MVEGDPGILEHDVTAMTKLVSIEGPLKGETFEVTELASIGRDEACAVRLEGRFISRIHARLEKSGEAMKIRDNGSRNCRWN